MKHKKIMLSILIVALIAAFYGCGQQETVNDTPLNKSDDILYGEAVDGDGYDYDGRGDEYAEPAAGAYDTAPASTTNPAATFDPSSEVSEPPTQPPAAGQLTAGVWDDNDNWGFFTNLVNTDLISFPSYGIDPCFRTVVNVKDSEGKPLPNAFVSLLDSKNNTLWTSLTDKNGIAYLFAPEGNEGVSAEIELDGQKQTCEIQKANNNSQSDSKSSDSVTEVTFDSKENLYKKTDIMFILDATGSMSDEMLFLQSEFTAITDKLGTDNTRYAVNFYRDEGDEYVTKCNSFTSNIKDLQNALNAESAQGGGDTPEAVADILKESIFESDWDEQSVKLAFLIFDAPPHYGTEDTINSAIKEASAKGIHIIPVVSSNSERETELFGRALAITTNGKYVFLTDDSGIGDSHLEPIIGYYEVQSLYDIIIDIVNEYKQ